MTVRLRLLCLPLLAGVLAACGGPPEPPEPSLARIEIESGGFLLTGSGDGRQLTATAYSSTGAVMEDVAISWQSSNPSAVTVSVDGAVSAVAAAGSSQIVARSGSVRSAPVVVLVAELVAGAATVSDSQVVAPFEPVDEVAAFGPGYRYSVGLSDAGDLTIGQILVAEGSAPIVGRVIGIAGDLVTLEVVPLGEVFASLDLNDEAIDLSNAPLEVLPGVEDFFDVGTASDGSLVFDLKGALIGSASLTPAQVGLYSVGPFTCVSTTPTFLSQLSLLSASIVASNDVEVDAAWSNVHQKIVVRSRPQVSMALSVRLSEPVDELTRISCNATLFEPVQSIPGALTVYLTASVPTGVGFEIAGSALPAGSGIDIVGSVQADLTTGFDCQFGSCSCPDQPSIATVTPSIAHVAPSLADGVAATIEAQAFAYTSTLLGIVSRSGTVAGAGHQAAQRFTEELMSMVAGTMTSANLANEATQARTLSFEPSYQAARAVRLEEGTISAAAAALMMLPQAVDLDCGSTFTLAGGSPQALSLSLSQEGGFEQGDQVEVQVELDPTRRDYLGENNVSKVVLYEVGADSMAPVAETLLSAGQSTASLQWVASSDSVEGTDYIAFIETPAIKDLRLRLGLVTLGPVLDGVILVHRTVVNTGNFATLPYSGTHPSAGPFNAGAGTYLYESESDIIATLVVRVKRVDGSPSFTVLDYEVDVILDGEFFVTYPVSYPEIECTGVRERTGTRRSVDDEVGLIPLVPEITVTGEGIAFTLIAPVTLRNSIPSTQDNCAPLSPIPDSVFVQNVSPAFAPTVRIDFDDESTFEGEVEDERTVTSAAPIDFFNTVTRGAGSHSVVVTDVISWTFGSQ